MINGRGFYIFREGCYYIAYSSRQIRLIRGFIIFARVGGSSCRAEIDSGQLYPGGWELAGCPGGMGPGLFVGSR